MRIMLAFIAMVAVNLAWGSERTASYVNDDGELYILHNEKCVHKYYTVPGFRDAHKMGQRLNRKYCWRYNGRGEFIITNFTGDLIRGDIDELVYEDVEGFDDAELTAFPTKRDRTPTKRNHVDEAADTDIQPELTPDPTTSPMDAPSRSASQPHDPNFEAKVKSGQDAQTEWVDADGKTHYRFVLH